jgi:hypothetical protein
MKIILWQRRDEPSLEFLRFEQDEVGILFDGTLVLDLDGEPARIDYFVECTPDWKTRRASIVQERAGVTSKLNITVDEEQRWYRDGELLDQFTGLTNIDLSVTPATNLLALRTMNLGIGQAQDTAAVWIVFPELEVKRLDQRYKKVDDTYYEYEAKAVDFEAILEVDDFGFITRYGNLWQTIRSSQMYEL